MTEGVGLPGILLAALVGGVGTWLVLTHGAAPNAGATHDTTGVASTPASAAPRSGGMPIADTGPWAPPPAAAAPATPSRAPASVAATAVPMAKVPPGADPADYALDDATLARRARTQFGLDCPEIAERAPRRNGHIDVVCSSGLVLRVHLMGDGPPRIAPGH